jgi:hypothetical protein
MNETASRLTFEQYSDTELSDEIELANKRHNALINELMRRRALHRAEMARNRAEFFAKERDSLVSTGDSNNG